MRLPGAAAAIARRFERQVPISFTAQADAVRLDKFMKIGRLSRRRSEAHEALVHHRISKDGKPLKPGYQVRAGDVLEIHYATKYVTVRIREVPLRMTPRVKPSELYEVIAEREERL